MLTTEQREARQKYIGPRLKKDGTIDGRSLSKRLTLDRLPSRICIEESTGCWIYVANKKRTQSGHVAAMFRGVQTFAHRAVWALTHGDIPEGLCVLHRCDNPRCVNPDHLFLGTPADNARDMVEKGRSLSGERNPKAKLTAFQVNEIRQLKKGGAGTTELARRFGVDRTTIQQIMRGATWSPKGVLS